MLRCSAGLIPAGNSVQMRHTGFDPVVLVEDPALVQLGFPSPKASRGVSRSRMLRSVPRVVDHLAAVTLRGSRNRSPKGRVMGAVGEGAEGNEARLENRLAIRLRLKGGIVDADVRGVLDALEESGAERQRLVALFELPEVLLVAAQEKAEDHRAVPCPPGNRRRPGWPPRTRPARYCRGRRSLPPARRRRGWARRPTGAQPERAAK